MNEQAVALDRAANVHGLRLVHALAAEIRHDLEHGDHRRAVLLGEARAVAEVVGMAMGQDDEVGALEPVLEALRMLGIAGPERVDQHAVAGDVQMKRRMAEPGQLHGHIPPAV